MSIYLYSNSKHITIQHTLPNGYYPAQVEENTSVVDGSLRINGTIIEYWNATSNTWQPNLGESAGIAVSYQVENTVEWVQANLVEITNTLRWVTKKMREEEELTILLQTYPALQKAKDQFEMIKDIVKNEVV